MKKRIVLKVLVLALASAVIAAVGPVLYFIESRHRIFQSPLASLLAVAVPFLVSAAAARIIGRLTTATLVAWILATGVAYITAYNFALWTLRPGGPGNLWPIEIAIMTAWTLGAQAFGSMLGGGTWKLFRSR
jgi:hypothetical protein